MPIGDFFLLPKDTPQHENVLEAGELITAISLPPPQQNSRQIYLKLRDRASYEFALSSAAVIAEMSLGKFVFIRVALGGVGTKPWRSLEAENILNNELCSPAIFQKAADAAMSEAKPQSQNAFKIELIKRCIVHTLNLATKPA